MTDSTSNKGDTPDKPVSFFDLSAELRNRIYEYTFAGYEHKIATPYEIKYSKEPTPAPGILASCRQAYTEAITIYYEESIFFRASRKELIAWLRRIGPIRREQVNNIGFSADPTVYQGYMPCEGSLKQRKLSDTGMDLADRRRSALRLFRQSGLDIPEGKIKVVFKLPCLPAGEGHFWTVNPKEDSKMRDSEKEEEGHTA